MPILYHVDRLREGRSYTTRSVKAVQHGKAVFVMMCSFQKPEPWQPAHQWHIPPGVPPPDECELEEVRYLRLAAGHELGERQRLFLQDFAAVSGLSCCARGRIVLIVECAV